GIGIRVGNRRDGGPGLLRVRQCVPTASECQRDGRFANTATVPLPQYADGAGNWRPTLAPAGWAREHREATEAMRNRA
ncbi:MAG: hypothetical protein ACREP6_10350, partial [Candidatus Binataceae bacterium]